MATGGVDRGGGGTATMGGCGSPTSTGSRSLGVGVGRCVGVGVGVDVSGAVTGPPGGCEATDPSSAAAGEYSKYQSAPAPIPTMRRRMRPNTAMGQGRASPTGGSQPPSRKPPPAPGTLVPPSRLSASLRSRMSRSTPMPSPRSCYPLSRRRARWRRDPHRPRPQYPVRWHLHTRRRGRGHPPHRRLRDGTWAGLSVLCRTEELRALLLSRGGVPECRAIACLTPCSPFPLLVPPSRDNPARPANPHERGVIVAGFCSRHSRERGAQHEWLAAVPTQLTCGTHAAFPCRQNAIAFSVSHIPWPIQTVPPDTQVGPDGRV